MLLGLRVNALLARDNHGGGDTAEETMVDHAHSVLELLRRLSVRHAPNYGHQQGKALNAN